MHRVELKDWFKDLFYLETRLVPNAPCGVESLGKPLKDRKNGKKVFLMHRVELKANKPIGSNGTLTVFLMHRVELKELAHRCYSWMPKYRVPNAPCGVESKILWSR